MTKIFSQIKSAIESSKNVLLHLHPSPDGDSLGSALAMYLYLKSLGKTVTLIKGDSELPESFITLPGYDQITSKNYFDLDLSRFDLFIILDTSAPNQISKLGHVIFPPNLKTIVIDHHDTNEKFGQLNLIDASSPSTSQIIYQYLHHIKANISHEIAINLFTGIYFDTGGFKYSKTSPATFNIAAKLTKIAPDFSRYIFNFENNEQPGRLLFKGLSYLSIKTYFSGRVALSAVSQKQMLKHGLSRNDTEKGEISNALKSVIGWDIGISLVETETNVCTLSLRTRDSQKYDLSLIAKNVGVGGGYRAAAGTTIYQPLSRSVKQLLSTIASLYPELGNP